MIKRKHKCNQIHSQVKVKKTKRTMMALDRSPEKIKPNAKCGHLHNLKIWPSESAEDITIT